MRKKELELILSQLKDIENKDPSLEQYSTPSQIAADMLWVARENIEGRTVADFGTGNGILAIGASLLGADKVLAIDADERMIDAAKENAWKLKARIEFIHSGIEGFREKVDTVVMNPPFGVQKIHADRRFLLKAFESADHIYSIHKIETEDFVRKICADNGFSAEVVAEINFPIKHQFSFHNKKVYKLSLYLWHLLRHVTR